MKVYTAQEIRQVEQYAVESGMDTLRLMENAGSACARYLREAYALEEHPDKPVAVVCGKGKNGGDGFVIARKLAEAGARVTVILALGEPAAHDAVEMFARLQNQSVRVLRYFSDISQSEECIAKAELVIDAVFGIGFSGEPNAEAARLFRCITQAPGEVAAIDLPSGTDCDTGAAAQSCVHADVTIAITALKPAHVMPPASQHCGKLAVVQIGIPDRCIDLVKPGLYAADTKAVRAMLPQRERQSNKGDFGHVLSICGSRNMAGAAVLAARGAVRMGAGLVTAAFPACAYPAIAPQLTEPLLLPLPDNKAGTVSAAALAVLLRTMKKASCVLIGCGLGQNEDTLAIAQAVVRQADCPIVVDADGINMLANHIDIWKEAKAPVVLTPHPGEMGRLLGVPAAQVQADRLRIARDFSREHNVTLVLKGAGTLVACPSGFLSINRTGNPGMAKGGSGDVLAGMLASLLAQGIEAERAAPAAAFLHGMAGDAAAQRLSIRGMTPSDLLEELPLLLSKFE